MLNDNIVVVMAISTGSISVAIRYINVNKIINGIENSETDELMILTNETVKREKMQLFKKCFFE